MLVKGYEKSRYTRGAAASHTELSVNYLLIINCLTITFSFEVMRTK